MKAFNLLSLIALGLFSLSATAVAIENDSDSSKKYLLRYKFNAQEFVRYEVDSKSRIVTKGKGLTEESENLTKTRKHFRVISVKDDGSAELELVLDSVYMEAQFDGNDPVILDSEDEENQPERYKHILETVGKPLARIEMTNRGEVKKTVRLTQGFQGNDKSTDFLSPLPEDSLAIGDSWKESYIVDVDLGNKQKRSVKLRRQYTLKSVENGIAQVVFKTVTLSPIQNPEIEARLIQQSPSKGEFRLDLNRGVILSRSLSINGHVVGALGEAGTMMSAQNTRTEKLITKAAYANQKTIR